MRSPSTSRSGWRRFGARPRSATHTTGNSRPLAAWMLIRRTASGSTPSTGASDSRAAGRLLQARGVVEEAAQVAALARFEAPARGAAACGRSRAAARPTRGRARARGSRWRRSRARSARRACAAEPPPARSRGARRTRERRRVGLCELSSRPSSARAQRPSPRRPARPPSRPARAAPARRARGRTSGEASVP